MYNKQIYLVARSRWTKLRDSKYLMPEAICVAIYSKQLKLKTEDHGTFKFTYKIKSQIFIKIFQTY